MSKNNQKFDPHRYAIVTLMILSIAAIAFLTYAHILRYFFTATDSLSLVDTSRIQSLKDVARIFTHPLMAGTRFQGLYYRPLANLSYSLDYRIWGLNPFGYHLTDLTLHIMVSVLVFIMMLGLTGDRKAVSWLSAVIFTTHPILVESVPAIARRHDIIAALFLLLSLVFFLKYVSAARRKGNWSLLPSIFAYALALGAKEISILLPFLIGGYLVFFSYASRKEYRSFKVNALKQMKICLPYFAVTVIYIVWRVYVLGGMGGHVKNKTSGTIMWFFHTASSYFVDLIYPIPIGEAVPENLMQAISLITLFVILVFLFSKRKVVLSTPSRLKRLLIGSDISRMVAFLSIWLLLPLGLFLMTGTFDHRSMYIPVIPFSAILSTSFVEGLGLTARRLTAGQSGINSYRLPYAANGLFIMSGVVIVYLLFFSPIAKTYGDWEDSGTISARTLYKLSEAVKELPDNATIHIYDLPAGLATYKTRSPHAKSVSYLSDYSIKSYLSLTDPRRRIEVVVKSKKALSAYPRDINLETTMKPGNNVVITFKADNQ